MWQRRQWRGWQGGDKGFIIVIVVEPEGGTRTIYNVGKAAVAGVRRGNDGHVVSRLDMYRTKVLMYRMMVLMARLTKVRR